MDVSPTIWITLKLLFAIGFKSIAVILLSGNFQNVLLGKGKENSVNFCTNDHKNDFYLLGWHSIEYSEQNLRHPAI